MKKIGSTIISVAVFIVAAFGAKYLLQSILSDGEEFNDQVLMEAASELNSTAPTMVDSETRLDSATASNNTFIYKYTLINYQKEDLDIEQVRNTIFPGIARGVCTTPELQVFREHGTTMKYNYYDLDGDFILSMEKDTKECP